MQRYQIWLLLGAVLGGISVGMGAFGAHGLEKSLKNNTSLDTATIERRLDNWETAARYQMIHSLALLAIGFVALRHCGLTVHLSGTAITMGTLLFSGCLYALVLTGQRWLVGPVPIGGGLLIVGWVLLAIAVAGLEHNGRANAGC